MLQTSPFRPPQLLSAVLTRIEVTCDWPTLCVCCPDSCLTQPDSQFIDLGHWTQENHFASGELYFGYHQRAFEVTSRVENSRTTSATQFLTTCCVCSNPFKSLCAFWRPINSLLHMLRFVELHFSTQFTVSIVWVDCTGQWFDILLPNCPMITLGSHSVWGAGCPKVQRQNNQDLIVWMMFQQLKQSSRSLGPKLQRIVLCWAMFISFWAWAGLATLSLSPIDSNQFWPLANISRDSADYPHLKSMNQNWKEDSYSWTFFGHVASE